MIPATKPVQRPATAKLLTIDGEGRLRHLLRERFVDLLRPGDLVVANDAATLPASLQGIHQRTGRSIEVRLAGWQGTASADVAHFVAVVFGAGDFHIRTEHRALPPPLLQGDQLLLGPLTATVARTLDHPRLVALAFSGGADEIWGGIARHGRPIQYTHLAQPLALWDVWTVVAGPPVAFEPPSAGFVLSWGVIEALHRRGIGFATITHAAGISSTGDEDLDKRLPFAEPYRIPGVTAEAIALAQAQGGRIVAIGTTVVRALEHAARVDGVVRAGDGVATQRIDGATPLSVVDAIVTGTHEPGTSHHDLLQAFVDSETMQQMDRALEEHHYRTHEFGDSVFIEKSERNMERNALNAIPCPTEVADRTEPAEISVGDTR